MLRAYADGQVFGVQTGSATPSVLALHGWARSHRDFDAVIGSGRDGDRELDAVALDLPGFGASPPPPQPWGSAEYAAVVAAALTDLKEQSPPLVVLGHSFGGRVSLHLAASRPDLVRGLVLTGVPQLVREGAGARRRPRPSSAFRVARALHRVGLLSERRMEAARQRHGSADYRAAQGIMRQVLVRVLSESYEEQLAALRCPVAMVWGDDDTAAPLAGAEAAAAMVPGGASLDVVPGAGHLTPLTAPAALRAAVERLLA